MVYESTTQSVQTTLPVYPNSMPPFINKSKLGAVGGIVRPNPALNRTGRHVASFSRALAGPPVS